MKNITFLLVSFGLLWSTGLMAQPGSRKTTTAPKKVSKIIVMESELNLIDLADVLMDEGYEIDYNKDLEMLKAKMLVVRKFLDLNPVNVLITIRTREGNFIVTGKSAGNGYQRVADSELYSIENRGMKNSPLKNAWLEMERVALLLSDDLKYE